MTKEQKIDLLEYLISEIKKIEADSLVVQRKFDESISFLQKSDRLCEMKYLEGRMSAILDLIKNLNLRSTPTDNTFCLN